MIGRFFISLVLALMTAAAADAQYYSVNIDYKTIAAMEKAYSTEAAMENLHNDNIQKIYSSYKDAELATAGIFSSKYLDRRALTSLNLWDSENENRYYTRIYKIVAKRIIPKTVSCAKLMVEDPSTALYWGSYLVRTTEDVKSLCKQFESVVTNSRLSFKDIAFVQIADELKSSLRLSQLGGVDWKQMLESIGGDIEGKFSKASFERDLDKLISNGLGLATSGSGLSQLMNGTDFGGDAVSTIQSILRLSSNAYGLYEQYKGKSAQQILTGMLGADNLSALFNPSSYNLTDWISDYSKAANGQYYTQRVYIYRKGGAVGDSGEAQEVYEEVFDSYSMDWNAFMAQMKARCQQYNANGDDVDITNAKELNDYMNSHPTETNYQYYIGYDSKRYYAATDAKKIAGSSLATISMTCHGGGTLGEGSTSYKCSECGSSLSEHTKSCSMMTTLNDGGAIETEGLETELEKLLNEESELQSQIDNLYAANSNLLRSMSTAETSDEYEKYCIEYESNKAEIARIEAELEKIQADIKDIRNAVEEAKEGEKAQTDDYNRIPQLMKAMQDAYGIRWTDGGSWSGYVFKRQGTIGGVSAKVTFTATLSIARVPKYFLFIKIHRAIVQIDWKLTSEWSDSSVAETIVLDTNNTDEQNAEIVNARIRELAIYNPGCDISVEYTKSNGVQSENTEGVMHLLWASDRLQIARGIEARLARIYTDLATIEKFMHYRHSLADWAKDLLPNLNAEQGRKTSIADQCRRRWMRNAGSSNYEYEYEE